MISISQVGLNKFIRANNNNNDNNVCSEILKVEGPFIVTIYSPPPLPPSITSVSVNRGLKVLFVFSEVFFTPG